MSDDKYFSIRDVLFFFNAIKHAFEKKGCLTPEDAEFHAEVEERIRQGHPCFVEGFLLGLHWERDAMGELKGLADLGKLFDKNRKPKADRNATIIQDHRAGLSDGQIALKHFVDGHSMSRSRVCRIINEWYKGRGEKRPPPQ